MLPTIPSRILGASSALRTLSGPALTLTRHEFELLRPEDLSNSTLDRRAPQLRGPELRILSFYRKHCYLPLCREPRFRFSTRSYKASARFASNSNLSNLRASPIFSIIIGLKNTFTCGSFLKSYYRENKIAKSGVELKVVKNELKSQDYYGPNKGCNNPQIPFSTSLCIFSLILTLPHLR